jgi:hypothetical protein
MKRTHLLGLAGVALVAATVLARAAGIFPGFPIVPSGAEVGGTTTTGTAVCGATGTCTNGALSGLETVPADTQLPGGLNPATINMAMVQLGAGAYYINAVTATAFSVTIPNNKPIFIVDTTGCAAGVCATGTITMPAAPVDGQQQYINATATGAGGTVTTLTLTPNTGQTIANIPTAITASLTGSSGYRFLYQAVAARWVRLQ